MNEYRICLSSPPDRNRIVAEIFFGKIQWAEINQENNKLVIQFYPRPDNLPWEIDFHVTIEALNEAKSKLIKISN